MNNRNFTGIFTPPSVYNGVTDYYLENQQITVELTYTLDGTQKNITGYGQSITIDNNNYEYTAPVNKCMETLHFPFV
mgnify:CR=1 FL=1